MLDKLISIAYRIVKYIGFYTLVSISIRLILNMFIDCRMYEESRGAACFMGDIDVTVYEKILTGSALGSILIVVAISALTIPIILVEKITSGKRKM